MKQVFYWFLFLTSIIIIRLVTGERPSDVVVTGIAGAAIVAALSTEE